MEEVTAKLRAAELGGLAAVVLAGLAGLRSQVVATASELNTKFAADGSGAIEMKYGEMDVFDKGVSGFVGPPLCPRGAPTV